MREIKAIVEDASQKIVNICTIDTEVPFNPGSGMTLIDGTDKEIGGTWDGTTYTPPVVPTPPTEDEANQAAFDEFLRKSPVFRGFVDSLNAVGTDPNAFVPNSAYTNAQMKTKVKNKM